MKLHKLIIKSNGQTPIFLCSFTPHKVQFYPRVKCSFNHALPCILVPYLPGGKKYYSAAIFFSLKKQLLCNPLPKKL